MARPLRPSLLAVLVGALALAGGVAMLLAGPDAAAPAPTATTSAGPEPGVRVGRTDGLADGQVVLVRGSGLPSGLEILVAPCGQEALEDGRFGSCDLDVAARTTTDDEGAFSVGYRVPRSIRVIGEDLDCAVDACVLSIVRSGSTLVELAREPLSFLPDEPVRPQLRALPRSDLSHRTPIRVRASGFDERIRAQQCVRGVVIEGVDGWCDPVTSVRAATVAGEADVVLTALRILVGPDGRLLDCLDPALRCELEVRDDAGASAVVPLWFDPDLPLPEPPSLLVDPAVGLGDRDEVRVVVAELLGATYDLELCPREPNRDGACAPVGSGSVRGPSGTATLAVRLPRLLADAAGTVDCAVAPGCELRLTGPHPTDPAGVRSVVVAFDPARPLQLPLVAFEQPPEGGAPGIVVATGGSVRPMVALCAPDTPDETCRRVVGTPEPRSPGVWAWPGEAWFADLGCPASCDAVVIADPGYPPVRAPTLGVAATSSGAAAPD